MMDGSETKKHCIDCKFAMPHRFSHDHKMCRQGYGRKRSLEKACGLFIAGEYEGEVKPNATI